MVEQAIRKQGIRELLSVTGSDREAFLSRVSAERKTEIPYRTLIERADVGEWNIPDCRTLILEPKNNAKGCVVLYLAGGAFMNPPRDRDYELALKITEKTGCDVIFPLYPLFPEHSVNETAEAVLEVVKRMDARYPEGATGLIGFSSGATLALYLFLELKRRHSCFRMPGRWILNSPVLRIPPDEADLRYMNILAPYDVILPVVFLQPEGLTGLMMERTAPGFRRFADIPSRNLSGMPETDLYLGTREILYAYRNAFEQRCETDAVPLHVHDGFGMMHCWGLIAEMKEGRDTQKEYFDILNTLKPIQ